MSLPTVLLTGFEPFDGEDVNPAQEVVRELAGERIAGHRVVPAVMPVTFDGALTGLAQVIDEVRRQLLGTPACGEQRVESDQWATSFGFRDGGKNALELGPGRLCASRSRNLVQGRKGIAGGPSATSHRRIDRVLAQVQPGLRLD